MKKMTIHLSAKCSDMFSMSVVNADGEQILDYNGYVPDCIPGPFGDYVEFEIENDTGRIINWKPVTKADMIDCMRS